MDAHAILGHIVTNVIPERCSSAKSDKVRNFYNQALDDPEAVIDDCKDLLHPWVMNSAQHGLLSNAVEYVYLSSSQSCTR